jgi:uncharacterized membrane protein YkvA (DUF1232 family)
MSKQYPSSHPESSADSNRADDDAAMMSGHKQDALRDELNRRAQTVQEGDEEKVLEQTPQKIQKMLDSASSRKPTIQKLLNNVALLYKMLRDTSFAMDFTSKTLVIAGLLYFISPIDLIPDYIPILGYIDDAFVISIVLNSLAGEIERYREHTGTNE